MVWFLVQAERRIQSCDEARWVPSIPISWDVPARVQAATATTWTLWFLRTLVGIDHIFHVKGKKKEERTLWIWRSKPLFKGFVHFVSRACHLGACSSYVFEMHRGGLMFMWNSFDKSRQTWVRKLNETKSPSMKLRSLLTQQLWGNTSNLDGHLTGAPSNFHRCN